MGRVVVLPNYIDASLGADIALLWLSDSVESTADIMPVRLLSAQLEVTPEHQCWVTGWGAIRMHGVYGAGAGQGLSQACRPPELLVGGWLQVPERKEKGLLAH